MRVSVGNLKRLIRETLWTVNGRPMHPSILQGFIESIGRRIEKLSRQSSPDEIRIIQRTIQDLGSEDVDAAEEMMRVLQVKVDEVNL